MDERDRDTLRDDPSIKHDFNGIKVSSDDSSLSYRVRLY